MGCKYSFNKGEPTSARKNSPLESFDFALKSPRCAMLRMDDTDFGLILVLYIRSLLSRPGTNIGEELIKSSCIRLATIVYVCRYFCYTPLKTVLEDTDMPRYVCHPDRDELQELKVLVPKSGKGYASDMRKYFLKLDQKPKLNHWTYDRIKR